VEFTLGVLRAGGLVVVERVVNVRSRNESLSGTVSVTESIRVETTNLALVVLGLVSGAVIIISSMLVCSGEPSKVKLGLILRIVFGTLSLFTGAGIAAFILTLIGGILGLTWKPPTSQPSPAQLTQPLPV
jgi:hypothetical protein